MFWNRVFVACLLGSVVCAQDVTFLTKAEAAKAIVDDSAEPYFDTMMPMEMSAKTGRPITGKTLVEQRKECRKRYAANALDFSDAEKKCITALVKDLQPTLKKEYPLFGALPWSFIKIKDTIEGGLPHTRGKHVVFSENVSKRFLLTKGAPAESYVRLRLLELLVHEQTHVFQRKYPKACDSLYTTLWKFQRAPKIVLNDYLKKYHLSNPDAVACPWVRPFKEGGKTVFYWPLVIFAEGDGLKRMPRDFRMVAIELDKAKDGFTVKENAQGTPTMKPLMQFGEYRMILPISSNLYHPDEMSADTFAKLVILDHFIPPIQDQRQKRQIETFFGQYRTWFKKNLAGKKGESTKKQ